MKKRLLVNTITAILLQITNVICGFVLPRLIIQQYGSAVNGLVHSIAQFLSVISFLELGVGAVIQSSLYKPISDEDNIKISQIIASGNKFFKKLAFILTCYVGILCVVYPEIGNTSFGWLYTVLLILAMSISSFSQYYFGIVDRLLLSADQRGYIHYTSQILTHIANTIACVILINLGVSIHVVKLTTSIIYLVRPLIIKIYINRHYLLDAKIKYQGEPINQKWNGVAQHTATVVLENTDSIVLTVFASLNAVSIYSVYHMVVYGVKQLFLTASSSVEAYIGNLLVKAKHEEKMLVFGYLEFVIHTLVVITFSCVGILIIPFISIYLNGTSDIAEYLQPLFAVLIVCAHAIHCIRLPYNILIKAGGHYKQTQKCYIIAAVMNVCLSIATVYFWGLIGVAIGTLLSMLYQTIWMADYISKNLINWPIKRFIKQCAVDLISIIAIYYATAWINLKAINYLSWLCMAFEVAIISVVISAIINFFFYRKHMRMLIGLVAKKMGAK